MTTTTTSTSTLETPTCPDDLRLLLGAATGESDAADAVAQPTRWARWRAKDSTGGYREQLRMQWVLERQIR